MPFVVVENCIRCKYTDCVEVCPVDCFHEGPNFLVIDPVECIDCTLCEPECPAKAIYPEDDVPAGQEHFTALNAEQIGRASCREKSVSVRVDLGGRRIIKQKNTHHNQPKTIRTIITKSH